MGLNSEHFFYALRVKDHKIFYEKKSDEGYSLASHRFQKLLNRLFVPINLGGEISVSVTVVPDEDALDKVLAIPKITTLDIFLTAPNPDENERRAARVLKRLVDAGAESQEIKMASKEQEKRPHIG